LPSVLSQVEQNFTWILIVDAELPAKYRKRLEKLISIRPNSYLHVFSKQEELRQLSWLKTYTNEKYEYVITTKLDDDDAIYSGHTKYVRDHLVDLSKNNSLPPIYFFGSYNVVLWDFFYSKRALLGYLKPRPKTKFPPSTGLSACCKYPEMDFSILSFGHTKFHLLPEDSEYFDELTPEIQQNMIEVRNKVKKSASISDLSWDGILHKDTNFHILSTDFPQALVMNHFQIAQYSRLISIPNIGVPVDIHSFPHIAINFQVASEYIRKFSISYRTLAKVVITSMKLNPDYIRSYGFFEKVKTKYKFLKQILRSVKALK